MADSFDPGASTDGAPDPVADSFANMDPTTAKHVSDSVYAASPAASLANTTPQQTKREGLAKRLFKWGLSWEDSGIRGATNAMHEVGKSAAGVVAGLNDFGVEHLGMKQSAHQDEYRNIQRDGLAVTRMMLDAQGPDTDTGLHKFVQGIAQFATARTLLGGGGSSVISHAATNMAADAFGFDPHQERLSNMLVNAPLGIGDVAKGFATNPNDSDAEARLRAAMEGLAMGSVIDAVVAGVKTGAGKVIQARKPNLGEIAPGAPKLMDFATSDRKDPLAPPKLEPFTIERNAEGGASVVVRDPEAAAAVPTDALPTFDTPAQANARAASLNYVAKNAVRPTVSLTGKQQEYIRSLAGWIRDTGMYERFQDGKVTVDASAAPTFGAHDVNFRYDLSPEQTGHIISSISTVLRTELEEARLPTALMRDPVGSAHIGNAETLAKAVQDFGGATEDGVLSKAHAVASAQSEVPAVTLATRILRQNIANQVESLSRQVDLDPTNELAHGELAKATSSLVNTFMLESQLKSGSGRALQALQIMAGKAGAKVNPGAFARAMGKGRIDPLQVLKFKSLEEALTPEDLKAMDNAAADNAERNALDAHGKEHGLPAGRPPLRPDAQVAGMEIPIRKDVAVKSSMNPAERSSMGGEGINTYTLIDEAEQRIQKAQDALDKLDENGPAPASDKQASAAVRKDAGKMDGAFKQAGVTVDDIRLAKQRLEAISATLAEKKKMGGKITNLSDYTDDELNDIASMHGERVKKLADEQRNNPLSARKERTVYMTKDQLRAMARQMTYAPRNVEEQAQVLDAILGYARTAADAAGPDVKPSLWKKIVTYRATAMLSAPTTGVVNFASALGQSLYRPMEGFVGAAFNGLDREGMKQQADLLTGTLKSFHDAWTMAKVSFDEGRTVLSNADPSMPMQDVWKDSGPAVKKIMDVLGFTGRLMTSGDEFAQQVSYRGHVYSQSLSNARKAGITGDALRDYVNSDLKAAFGESQQGINPAALSYAQDVTLRRPLEGTIGKGIESMARESPIMRLLFPFVRIPVNLVDYQIQRAPGVGMLTKRFADDMAAGGAQRNEAIGRQVAGASIWFTGLMMAHAGVITGGGPSDPELRRTWLGADGKLNQPYSVKIGNQWISYRRFEPLSTPLGIMADFHQMMGELEDGDQTGNAVSAFMAGLGQNLLSKTYMKSLSDMMYAIGSGQQSKMEAFIEGMAGSFIPNAASKLDFDDGLKDTRGFWSAMASRVPGLSSLVETRRNIYGEKVMKPANQFMRAFNPFTATEVSSDEVDHELLRLGAQMSMPGDKKFGVDLKDRSLGANNQSPYDRWMELMSTSQDGEPTLRQALRELVQSDDYKAATDSQNGFKGSKLLMVEGTVRKYRAMAFAKMIEEDNAKRGGDSGVGPIMKAMKDKAGMRAAVLSGDPDMAEALSGKGDAQRMDGLAKDAQAFIQ